MTGHRCAECGCDMFEIFARNIGLYAVRCARCETLVTKGLRSAFEGTLDPDTPYSEVRE